MDKHHELLVQSLEQARVAILHLRQARPNDPRFTCFNRHMTIVDHAVEAAMFALLDTGGELQKLRGQGVKL